MVDVGVTRMTGTGTVRNLRNVADFSGNYVSLSAGATVAGGGAATTLRNQNGVVIDGISTSQGVRLTLAPGGVNITLWVNHNHAYQAGSEASATAWTMCSAVGGHRAKLSGRDL